MIWRFLVTCAGIVIAVAVGMPAAAADVSPQTSCSTGYVCFYNQPNYGGTPCKWQSDDDDWSFAPGVCSWASSKNVRSMYNQGTSGLGVAFYSRAGWDGYLGWIDQYEGRTNVDYHIESHFWTE